MKRSLVLSLACMAAFAICAPHSAWAKKNKGVTATEPTTTGVASTKPMPYHGKITAVDQTAKTVAVATKEGARVLKVTNRTALKNSGQTVAITDLAVNADVHGFFWRSADGTLEAKSVKLGVRTGKKKAKKAGSPSPTASP